MIKRADPNKIYDAIIIGSGASGATIAYQLTQSGLSCLLLEAGQFFSRSTFPRHEIDGNSQLYWAGGIELNTNADLALLRAKAVGGGTVVNQALLDRFDIDALESFQATTGMDLFSPEQMEPLYRGVEEKLSIQTIPPEHRNENAKIFMRGCQENNFAFDSLTRAQSDCRNAEGNDCIECLNGCRADSKQSLLITLIPKALKEGLTIKSQWQAGRVIPQSDIVTVEGTHCGRCRETFRGRKLVLAAGSLGNTQLLWNSELSKFYPALGKNFYTHPQFMVLGLFDRPINAHKGAFQAVKSADPNFRKRGFKLENVFAPPVAIAMLLPGHGKRHLNYMQKINQMACIEVAIRDTNPGSITLTKGGKLLIEKSLNHEDGQRKKAGLNAIHQIFTSQKALEVIEGELGIGLHLMGGLKIGQDHKESVVTPEFKLYAHSNIYAADSSIFPNAPGINPSFTIMALSLRAAQNIIQD